MQPLPKVLLALVVACHLSPGRGDPISTLPVAEINAGFTAAEELVEFINSKNFHGTLTKLSQAIGPYLGAIGPLVAFGLSFANTESPELIAIKALARRVDEGFHRIDSQFEDIGRKLDWLPVMIKVMEIEQRIQAVQDQFEILTDVQASEYEDQKEIFIMNYESDYQSSGTKLYEAILNENHVNESGILRSVMEYTQYDRNKYHTFTLGLLQLLLTASKLELAYLELKGFHQITNYYENRWNERLVQVGRTIKDGDDTIVNESPQQFKRDVDRFASDNPADHMNNANFARSLYDFLDTKFYWLDWIVVAYDPVAGWDMHCLNACHGHIKFRFYGRNLLVSYVPKTKPNIDLNTAASLVDSIPVLTRATSGWYAVEGLDVTHAQRSYGHFPSSVRSECTYEAVGVIVWNAWVSIYAPPHRLVDRIRYHPGWYYAHYSMPLRVFLFG